MSDLRRGTEGKAKLGAWCCPNCKNKCKTLSGINRHLYREHKGEGFGVYRTAQELQAAKRK